MPLLARRGLAAFGAVLHDFFMAFAFRVLACAAALSLALVSCGAPEPIPADAVRTVVSLDKIDCADCGDQMVADLRERPGVYAASFDKRKAEITVVASRSFDVFTAVKQLASVEGFVAVMGAGKGRYLDWSTFPPGADVLTVAKSGEDVPDLKPHLAEGKVTVVDFSAIWCEPCRKLDEHMAKLLVDRQDVAYRKLDIGDWDTPLAKRYLKSVPALPYVIVFGANGVRVGEVAGLDLARVDAAIAKGAKPKSQAGE
jgi:thiol-disulfide isomerase/thioredoxin